MLARRHGWAFNAAPAAVPGRDVRLCRPRQAGRSVVSRRRRAGITRRTTAGVRAGLAPSAADHRDRNPVRRAHRAPDRGQRDCGGSRGAPWPRRALGRVGWVRDLDAFLPDGLLGDPSLLLRTGSSICGRLADPCPGGRRWTVRSPRAPFLSAPGSWRWRQCSRLVTRAACVPRGHGTRGRGCARRRRCRGGSRLASARARLRIGDRLEPFRGPRLGRRHRPPNQPLPRSAPWRRRPFRAFRAPTSPAGPPIGSVRAVDAAGSATFTVPATGDPGILVQLADGSIVAFDAGCTHAGCPVDYVPQDKLLECPCHGAIFDPAQGGAVLAGPTSQPLLELPIVIDSHSGRSPWPDSDPRSVPCRRTRPMPWQTIPANAGGAASPGSCSSCAPGPRRMRSFLGVERMRPRGLRKGA